MEAVTDIKCEVRLVCPSCLSELGGLPVSTTANILCDRCKFVIAGEGAYWDACADKSYPRDFSRQWVLWENGMLGDPTLVYGHAPEYYFEEFLAHTGLVREDLATRKILEIGFGHGRLLHQIQEYCPQAYGLDLSKPLASAQLRPGSAFFGNLLAMPFAPEQFDIVICRGVVHHTPDPQASFRSVADQVVSGGILYLAGCYEPGKKAMLKIRKVFRRSWEYPEPVLLALSGLLSGCRGVLEGIRRGEMNTTNFRTYANKLYKLDIFDVLAPRWSGQLGADTLFPWFVSAGFQVRKAADGSYVGTKR